MRNNKSASDFFWPSYTDLMTSLFFVMLLLYVLTYVYLKVQHKATKDQLARIQALEKAVSQIDPSNFEYNEEYKKHVLKMNVQFPPGKSDINLIPSFQRDRLATTGRNIVQLIKNHQNEENVKFLVIIEGQASKDNYGRNYELSYIRALSLQVFWKQNDIRLDQLPNCELILAGSGTSGVPRKQPDLPPNNQRFLIHIIPKIGSSSSTPALLNVSEQGLN